MGTDQDRIRWYDVREFGIEGKGWVDTELPFDRLPARAKGRVRDVIWDLSRHAAGMSVRFETGAADIHARWRLRSANLASPRCPASGMSGLDLYARDAAGRWRWAGAAGDVRARECRNTMLQSIDPGARRYMLYLPFGNPVDSVEVGVPEDAELTPLRPRRDAPIVFYGTSICHGYDASRPGMPHPAVLGRRLDRPVINLGFAGNAHMEPEFAELLAELDPAVYVIDPLPNMTGDMVDQRAETFIRTLRGARPATPIVLVEDRTYTNAWLRSEARSRHDTSRAAFRRAYRALQDSGVTGMLYVAGEHLLGEDGEATVDSSHPSDLGFVRMADALEPILRALL
jgi:hypothetical protein